jgi:DNA-binding transcriptional LysR family regulator
MTRNYRYKEIHLSQLRTFCVTAIEHNFTTAAKILGLSVPTVWEQVRALERRLSAPLLGRHGREVELTDAGRLLLELIHPCVSGLDSLERVFAARLAGLPQSLTVISTPYLLAHHLVRPVQEFTSKHPTVVLSLHADVRTAESIRLAEQGKAELVIAPYLRDEPRSSLLEYEELFHLPLLLLTPPDHALMRKKKLSAHDLVRQPLIAAPKYASARKSLEAILQRQGLQEQWHEIIENANTDVVCKYVAAGVGIALMYAGEEDFRSVPEIQVRVFDPHQDTLAVALVVRKDAYLSEPAQEFRRTVRQCLAANGRQTKH